METFIGWFLILLFFLWYLVTKQKKRDKEKNTHDQKLKILSDVKQQLYQYALAQGKIGKNKCVDIEGEGGYYPYKYNEKDINKVYELVDKYELNILQDKYAQPIRVSSYAIPNLLEYIIPFLKREIDKFPNGKDEYYSFEKH